MRVAGADAAPTGGIADYRRQFSLLACIAAALAAGRGWHPWQGVAVSAGIYGALHAAALSLSLRAPRAPLRKWLFVAAAACLCIVSVETARIVGRCVGILTGMGRLSLLLALASGLGAASYALLVRWLWMPTLPLRALVSITLLCVSATLAVLMVGSRLIAVGGTLGFAVGWWFAFSAGLWYHDAA